MAIDRFITEQITTQRMPGLALAIIQGDAVRSVKGYGAARANEPVTPQTQFILASLSKSFTAVAILQLVEAGQIDLDAPVQRYLPAFTLTDADVARQITVRQLLNQTSGLADAGVPDLWLPRPATSAERITTLREAHTVAVPGRAFHYTDVNYQILGQVVEVVSRQPLSVYLHEQIFAPLQMTQTVNVMTSKVTMRWAGLRTPSMSAACWSITAFSPLSMPRWCSCRKAARALCCSIISTGLKPFTKRSVP